MAHDGASQPSVDFDRKTNMITITPKDFSATVIFMHGLGDTARGWYDAAEFWSHKMPHARFVLPTAPTRPVTLNGGMPMPAWYDLAGLGERADEKCEGIEGSRSTILKLVQAEVAAGISHDRIVVGGFSQGGAMSLWSGLQSLSVDGEEAPPLAGVLCMSGYLANAADFRPAAAALATPLLMAHGTADPMVLFKYAEKSREALKGHGFSNIIFKSYAGMEHTAIQEEVNDVLDWLLTRLPPQ